MPTRDGAGRRRPPAARQRRPIRTVAIALVVSLPAIAIVLVIALGGGDNESSGTVGGATAAAGQPLSNANCSSCHGVELLGSATGPPFLDVIYAPNHHSDEAFQRAAALGVVPHHWDFGPMPPVTGGDSDDVRLITAYVRSPQRAAGVLRDPSHP